MHNGERLKRLRKKLNLSLSEAAYLLGLSGEHAADRIREIERGARDMSGSLLNVLRYIETGAYSDLPAFALCNDANGAGVYVMHNHWPRFILKPTKGGENNAQGINQARDLVLIDGNNAALLCWIDEPLNDHKEATQTAIDLLMRANHGARD